MSRFVLLAALACLATTVPAHGQSAVSPNVAFTANDALDVETFTVADLTRDGRWVAATSAKRRDALGVDYRRDGDPTYIRPASVRLWIIDTQSGSKGPVFPEGRNLRNPVWSPDGSRLAFLSLRGESFEPVIYDRATARTRALPIPAGRYVAENSDIRWTNDGTRVVVTLRSHAWRERIRARFAEITGGPVFVQSSSDPFLAWDDLRRQGNVRAVYGIDVATGKATELVPETMIGTYALSHDDSVLTYSEDITRKTDYDVIFGSENKLMMRQLASGASEQVLPSLKGINVLWAEDGRRYIYGSEGRVFVSALGQKQPRQIAGPDSSQRGAAQDTSAAGRERRANERFSPVRLAPSGDAVVMTNRQGIWLSDVASGQRELIIPVRDSVVTDPRYTVATWSQDGRFVYFNYASRTKWERGWARYDRTAKKLEELRKDGRIYSGLRLARNGDVAVYTAASGNRPGELHVSDLTLGGERRLVDANPQLRSRGLATTSLLTYLDIDGKTRYGVVYYPPGFTQGRRYPTLFNIYEDFFDDTFDATANVFTSRGYVVVKPSVAFETGYPGEAWLKAVTAAANKLIESGVADSSKLGVFGTSYGGYATNLLITQTNRFKAAVNVSGKVDIISFYTDSPRLGVRNIHAAEKSQDRIGATLWQQPQKYVAHSAVMFADRITTPLLLITGEQDSNVPAGNTREMYYALRRLGKDVTWVNYMNSGHGTPGTNATEFTDYHDRMLAFFGRHLKGESQGVVEATSLLGEPLHRTTPSATARETLERNLAAAKAAYDRSPNDADSIIWLGRRTAYLGRFNDAIAIYSEGVRKHPNDARMYRHRGHRYLSVRKIDDAVRDFEKAASLVKGKADQVEPDGQPNARNIPTSTLQSNIWYHLGLAYYLKGEYEQALRAYREDLAVAKNPDMQVAVSHWLYMTLRRMGRTADAAKVLEPIRRDMDIIENGSYHRLLLLYKGDLTADSLPKNFGAEGALEDITTAYGVANWHYYNGRRGDAEAIWRKVITAKSQWASFGYLASEAEVKRLGTSASTNDR